VIVMTVNRKYKPYRIASALLLLAVLTTGIAEWRYGGIGTSPDSRTTINPSYILSLSLCG
jgi:hypothetical protein